MTQQSYDYNIKRCRTDKSDPNINYKHFVPNRKGPKAYLMNFDKKSKLQLRLLAETNKATCPICGLSNVPLAEHMLTFCSSTVAFRLKLLKRLRINPRNYNLREAKTLLINILEHDTDKLNDNYLRIVAELLEFSENKIKVQEMEPHEFIGKIIDFRQDEKWFRTRIIHYCRENDSLVIDSKNLDKWPFDYHEFDLETCRNPDTCIKIEYKNLGLTDKQCAIILRPSNILSFSNLDRNVGKVLFLNGHPVSLVKHIEGSTYVTSTGVKLNLCHLIRSGGLNNCILNGVVARRYESTNWCESNAVRYGKP